MGKPEGKRPFGRPTRRWEDIMMKFQEVGCGGMDWVELARDREMEAGACEWGNKPSVAMKCGEFLDQLRTG